jgi:hypothetical protein
MAPIRRNTKKSSQELDLAVEMFRKCSIKMTAPKKPEEQELSLALDLFREQKFRPNMEYNTPLEQVNVRAEIAFEDLPRFRQKEWLTKARKKMALEKVGLFSQIIF